MRFYRTEVKFALMTVVPVAVLTGLLLGVNELVRHLTGSDVAALAASLGLLVFVILPMYGMWLDRRKRGDARPDADWTGVPPEREVR
jgi:hypothetical protein